MAFNYLLTMRFFIGVGKNPTQEAKRFILCYQLIAFLPMFLFVDIGDGYLCGYLHPLYYLVLENIFEQI